MVAYCVFVNLMLYIFLSGPVRVCESISKQILIVYSPIAESDMISYLCFYLCPWMMPDHICSCMIAFVDG